MRRSEAVARVDPSAFAPAVREIAVEDRVDRLEHVRGDVEEVPLVLDRDERALARRCPSQPGAARRATAPA